MSIANTKVFGNSLDKDMDKIFFDSYNEYQPLYTQFMKMETAPKGPSYTASELSPLSKLREINEGAGIEFDTPTEGNKKTIYYKQYALGFQVTRIMVDDDLFGNFKKMPSKLGKSANVTLETSCANLFNLGFTSETAWDGQNLFDVDHVTIKGGNTIANEPTTAGDLTETTLQSAFEYFKSRSLVDEAGFPIFMNPEILLIPPELEHTAARLVKTLGYVGTNLNDINTLNPSNGVVPSLKIVVNPYLTSTTAFFVLSKERENYLYWKNKVEFTSADDFRTGNALFKAWMRYGVFGMNYKGMYGNPGA